MPPAIKELILYTPNDIIISSSSNSGMIVNYPNARTTGGKNPVKITYSKLSGSIFPVGLTEVTITAKSKDGQVKNGTFSIYVNLAILPLTLIVPSNIIIKSNSPIIVNYPPAIISGGQSPVNITYDHPSGSIFQLGDTTVKVTAVSSDGQTKVSGFIIRVEQQVATPPLTIICPSNIVTQSPDGNPVIVNYPPATVNGGTPPYIISYNPSSGSSFPIDTTTVNVAVVDSSNPQKSAFCSFTVQVTLTPPPPGTHPFIWLDNATRTLVTTKKNISDSDWLANVAIGANYLAESSPQFTIASALAANPVQITLVEDVPWSGTFPVYIAGASGAWAGINNDAYPGLTATKTGTKTFTIPINGSGFGSFSGQTPVIFPFDANNAIDYSGYSYQGLGWSDRIRLLEMLHILIRH